MNPIVKIIIEDTPTDATNETKLTTASTIICLILFMSQYTNWLYGLSVHLE
jgi:hypothetical protein